MNGLPDHQTRMIEFYEALRRRDATFRFEDLRPSTMHRFPRSEDCPSMGWVDPEDPGLDSFDGAGWLLEDTRVMVGHSGASDEIQRAAYANVLAAFAEAGLRAEWNGDLGEPIWLRRSDEVPIAVVPDHSASAVATLAHQQGVSPAALALGGLERAFLRAQTPQPVS